MKVFKKKVSKNKVYREYVDILNGKLQLSYREADVFAVLLQINQEWGNMVKETGDILSTDIRRVLMRETLVTKTNLGKYITRLKEKGVLVPNGKRGLMINEMFIPDYNGKTCESLYILEVE